MSFFFSSFKNFFEYTPEKFQNKTNGITPRRWLRLCNPTLSDVISEVSMGDPPYFFYFDLLILPLQQIGEDWVVDLYKLRELAPLAGKEGVLKEIFRVKQVSLRDTVNHF